MTKAAELIGMSLENLDRYGWVKGIGIKWDMPPEAIADLHERNCAPEYKADWVRGVCLTGSMSVTMDYRFGEPERFTDEDRDEAYCALVEVIREQFGTGRLTTYIGDEGVQHIHETETETGLHGCYTCIIFFNDHDDTTLTDVKLVLEKAKLQLEERV